MILVCLGQSGWAQPEQGSYLNMSISGFLCKLGQSKTFLSDVQLLYICCFSTQSIGLMYIKCFSIYVQLTESSANSFAISSLIVLTVSLVNFILFLRFCLYN